MALLAPMMASCTLQQSHRASLMLGTQFVREVEPGFSHCPIPMPDSVVQDLFCHACVDAFQCTVWKTSALVLMLSYQLWAISFLLSHFVIIHLCTVKWTASPTGNKLQ